MVVEGDRGGEAAEACEDAFFEAGEGAGAVAFEGEVVFAGPEARFDPLADGREMRPCSAFVLAVRALNVASRLATWVAKPRLA